MTVVDKSDQFTRRNIRRKVIRFFPICLYVLVVINVLQELIYLLYNVALSANTGVFFFSNSHVRIGLFNFNLLFSCFKLLIEMLNFVIAWKRHSWRFLSLRLHNQRHSLLKLLILLLAQIAALCLRSIDHFSWTFFFWWYLFIISDGHWLVRFVTFSNKPQLFI